jgi:hypothetical protein
MKRKQAREVIRELILEISADTFKSAIGVSKQRGTTKRTHRLGALYFNKFKGQPLIGGTIAQASVDNETFDQPTLVINVVDISRTDTNRGQSSQNIFYSIDTDEYSIEDTPISRKDARTLSLIAQHVNPNTKYKQPGATFKIAGDHY